MIEAHSGHRDSRTSIALFYVILILMAAIYYIFLALDGGFNLFKPIELAGRGMAFNSMLEHLLHGEFDVDPAAIMLRGSFVMARPIPILALSRHFCGCRYCSPALSRGSTSRVFIVLSR